jgi:hypothetical protein
MNNQRELFEKWFTGEGDTKTRYAMMTKDDNGFYKYQSAQNAWEVWQAALEQVSEAVCEVSQEAFGRGNVFWFKECPPDGTKLYISKNDELEQLIVDAKDAEIERLRHEESKVNAWTKAVRDEARKL